MVPMGMVSFSGSTLAVGATSSQKMEQNCILLHTALHIFKIIYILNKHTGIRDLLNQF